MRVAYLNSMLEAVELEQSTISRRVWSLDYSSQLMFLTSQQEFAIWQPAWPTGNREVSLMSRQCCGGTGMFEPR